MVDNLMRKIRKEDSSLTRGDDLAESNFEK
jgi:hypothetical protein